jgi:NTP pyrophosphatase (non-canonical NTP hydrolase)
MDINHYQFEASTTANYPREKGMEYTILGLNGEAGEVADKYKKIIRDKESVIIYKDTQELAKELGDVLWYVAMLAKELGYSLEDIAQMNIDKLRSRQERGVLGGSGDNR